MLTAESRALEGFEERPLNVVLGTVSRTELASDRIQLKWCEVGFVVAAAVTVFLTEVRSYITQKVYGNISGNWKQYLDYLGIKISEAKDILLVLHLTLN